MLTPLLDVLLWPVWWGAVIWVRGREAQVLTQGLPLNDAEERLAQAAGVRDVAHVRVLAAARMPTPLSRWVQSAAERAGLLSPHIAGMTFGHGIVLRVDCRSDARLLVHELTHCLMFQHSGTRVNWAQKGIPLWFREGMAVATAGQARHYPSLEDSARWLERNRSLDVFRDGEALSAEHAGAVYGIALHAFEFMERRYGRQKIRTLMAQMSLGSTFELAFGQTLGVAVALFQRDFENYLRFRAFRGARSTLPPVHHSPAALSGQAQEAKVRVDGDRL